MPFLLLVGALLATLALRASSRAASMKVLNRERASGVLQPLQVVLDRWELEGTHTIVIAGGPSWPYPGGLRTDASEQAAAAAGGLSRATTLDSTPHGRGAALDVWPEGFDPRRGFDTQPGMKHLMAVFGEWAERQGLEWGGRWQQPDMPHVQLRDWRQYPYPPRGVA